MLFAISAGVLSAVTILIVMFRLGIRKFMGYPAILDLLVTGLLIVVLHGTLGGDYRRSDATCTVS